MGRTPKPLTPNTLGGLSATLGNSSRGYLRGTDLTLLEGASGLQSDGMIDT